MFGKPTQRQTDVWEVEKTRADGAFEAAKIGATCESVDAAARAVIVKPGFGPGYKLPGTPHRTGHGIGQQYVLCLLTYCWCTEHYAGQYDDVVVPAGDENLGGCLL